MQLVIVESQTKAKTISKFLGKKFKVESSYGHIRDLPKSTLGIDVENNFEPKYIVPVKAKKVVKQLKLDVQKSDEAILATDQDREGEAIAWHLVQALGLNEIKNEKGKSKSFKRIVFHEITKTAIERSLTESRELDMNMVDAQQARRILDRLVGYKLSPFLWKKVTRGLSAGRVQSVAVRLIVEREREIQAFKPEEYWQIEALLSKNGQKDTFKALLVEANGEKITKLSIKNQKQAQDILKKLEGAQYLVKDIKTQEKKRYPSPPFTTSTLQQEAGRKLGFSAKKTMRT